MLQVFGDYYLNGEKSGEKLYSVDILNLDITTNEWIEEYVIPSKYSVSESFDSWEKANFYIKFLYEMNEQLKTENKIIGYFIEDNLIQVVYSKFRKNHILSRKPLLNLIELLEEKFWDYSMDENFIYTVLGNEEYKISKYDEIVLNTFYDMIVNW